MRVMASLWFFSCADVSPVLFLALQVDIRFPQSGAPDPNCVTVTGLPENVEEAIDHILNLEEEYVSVQEICAGASQGFSLPQSWKSEVSPCGIFYHCIRELKPCTGGSQPSSAAVLGLTWRRAPGCAP